MRQTRSRRAALAALLLCAIAPAADANAAPNWTRLDTAQGAIGGVDAGRILFLKANHDWAVKNRRTDQLTQVPTLDEETSANDSTRGFLEPHGAIFQVDVPGQVLPEIVEWRDGTLVDLDQGNALTVKGSWAVWSVGNTLLRRDLATGAAPVTITTTAASGSGDVAANGDVVFSDSDLKAVRRYRGGTIDLLGSATGTRRYTDPATDGTNVMWADIGPCCGTPDGSLRAYGPSGDIALADTQRANNPVRGVDYRLAGGWIAFTRGVSRAIWTRAPGAVEAAVSPGDTHGLIGLDDSGDVMYAGAESQFTLYLANAGSAPVQLPYEPAAGWAPLSGRWYAHGSTGSAFGPHDLAGDTWFLDRLSLTDAPADGSETHITGPAPHGIESSTSAQFTFSSDVLNATFECQLDGGGWQSCSSPQSYSPLGGGTHTFLVRTVEPGGNRDPDPASQKWTVDTTPPSVTLIAPDAGAVTADSTPSLSGDAGTADGDSATVSVDIYAGNAASGTPVQTADVARSGGGWSHTAQTLADGVYTARARQSDSVGHTGHSEARTFTVDTSPPASFSQTAPDDGASGVAASPQFSWEPGSDAGTGVSRYELWVDGANQQDVPPGACGASSCSATSTVRLSESTHTWQVVAVDGLGRRRETATRSFTVAFTSPSAALAVSPNPALTGDEVTLDASGSTDPHGGQIVRYEWDLNGDGSFDRTSSTATTATSYAEIGDRNLAVRVTDDAGLSATATKSLSVRPKPPAGLPGVSINGGDRFTNDPHVTVDVVWTPFATALVMSNDGGFRTGSVGAVEEHVPWTLDSSGSERLPRTIYARFAGAGGRETYQDDIILDETAPRLLAVQRRGAHGLRVVARDNVSGVKRMQVTANRHKPGPALRYRRFVTVKGNRSKISVRVRDAAGNWSRWKRWPGSIPLHRWAAWTK
jgi:Big-like domain-containing protein/PKD domain-containing protein